MFILREAMQEGRLVYEAKAWNRVDKLEECRNMLVDNYSVCIETTNRSQSTHPPLTEALTFAASPLVMEASSATKCGCRSRYCHLVKLPALKGVDLRTRWLHLNSKQLA